MRSSILIFLFVFVVLVQSASSAGMLAYGVVRIDGEPASAGSVLTARIVDEPVGNCSVGSGGSYSLLVSSDGLLDAPVEFYVEGARAVQVVPFASESMLGIDLDFKPVATTSTSAPSSSSTTFSAPAASGNAVAITVGDNFITFLMFIALLSIAYSVSDILL